ncbi:hypothetical protein CC78DRAFT_548061 [Lojkania enalia]|uniref:Uncharacterized protein n=1 Tax=Lojkania enalia TaxID=147567 RepID=A0A9P4N2G4_9PLEO|nr:hypothetical protein CC78DRAFT_548061 [Didymosphaeria enalia]
MRIGALAARECKFYLLRKILKRLSVEVCIQNSRGMEICNYRYLRGQDDIVQEFIDNGLKVIKKGYENTPKLPRAALQGGNYYTCQLLVESGVGKDFEYTGFCDELCKQAATGGSMEALQLLMKRIELVNHSILFAFAAEGGHIPMVDFFLRNWHRLEDNSKLEDLGYFSLLSDRPRLLRDGWIPDRSTKTRSKRTGSTKHTSDPGRAWNNPDDNGDRHVQCEFGLRTNESRYYNKQECNYAKKLRQGIKAL